MACLTDTYSIDLTDTGGNLSADLILDPDPANAAEVNPDGLFVSGANETGWFATGETWTSLGADAPNYTVTIIGDKTTKYEAGMRVKVTQATDKYFIIVAAAYDAGTGLTTLTLYGGTDYSLTGAAITASYYSVAKKPLGFNTDPLKWTVVLDDAADHTQASPVQNTWYNLGSLLITVPIGSWDVWYEASVEFLRSTSGQTPDANITLSTANNSESDPEFTSKIRLDSTVRIGSSFFRRKTLLLAAKTVYYLNERTTTGSGTTLGLYGSTYSPTLVRARCAYL